jgi:hypothetical protein
MEAPVPADRDSPAGFYGSMGRMAHQQVLARVKEVLVFGDGRPDDASLDRFRHKYDKHIDEHYGEAFHPWHKCRSGQARSRHDLHCGVPHIAG